MENILETIHKSFEKELADLVCRKVKHQDYCQDIIQEVYLKILLNQSKIEKADNISAYLTRLTTNTVVDYYRRKSKSLIINETLPETSSEPDETVDSTYKLADCCLRSFIDSLPEIYRNAIIMVELDALKIKDYAVVANITLTNAKARVQRARKMLREVILRCCNYEFDSYGNIVSCKKNGDHSCCK